jgi:hypothetical protein
MTELKARSAELFEQLVEALVDEGMQTGEIEIDSMRYAQMELLGHGLGQDLSRRVQAALSDRQGRRMPSVFPCPRCHRECPAEQKSKPMTSLDGDVDLPETRCYCQKCRKNFFPSA